MTSKEIDLDALEKAALAASPGPWEYAEDKYVNRRVQTVGGKPDYVVWPYEATCVSEEDGAYIAAANPAVVLELIRRLREAEIGSARYEKVRKLHPMEYQLLYHRNLKGEASFDDLIDAYKIGDENAAG